MKCKNENSLLTVNLNLTDQTETSDLQAYVFSSGGKRLGSAPISVDEPAVINLPDNMDGRTIEVLLGPVTKENEPAPTVSALKRAGAYALPGRYLLEKPEFNIKIPGIILPPWCICNVTGRVINRVTLPDSSVEEMPVCNARVHICEVDPWYLILTRIPDYEIYKLRDDLLERLYPVERPIPIPDPGPYFKRAPANIPIPDPGPYFKSAGAPAYNALPSASRQPGIESNFKVFSAVQSSDTSQQLALTVLANTSSIKEIRAQLLQLDYLLYPYWCFFPYIWPYYHKDCIRTVDVDSTGHFSTTIHHDCNDQPDLYFWVEQLQDGVWTTVYKPSVACHTHWNYECNAEVVINAPNAEPCEVPGYDVPDGVTLFVLPYKIGYTPIWGTPAGAPLAPDGWVRSDGFVNYHLHPYIGLGWLHDAPFGGTLRFHHDDSYFIPKDDSAPGTDDNSIKYYRYSYRRVDDTGDWTAMTSPQSRGYRMEYDDGSLPTYESYPINPQTVGGESNLFEFKPRTPPERVIDPPTVVVREWTSGNLNDIAASWDTNTTAPAMDVDNTDDDAGTFEVKIEVFNESGQQVMPGASTFEFLALNSDTTTTRYADAGEISNGAFVFKVHIDNNNVTAALPQPSIGGVQASDDCGFLRYDDVGDLVHVEFTATHPNDHAVFKFTIKRGSNVLTSTADPYTETAATSAPPYNDISGVYQNDFMATSLVGTCVNAAFAADLHIWGKATDGRYRLGIYDRRLIAFALAESEDET